MCENSRMILGTSLGWRHICLHGHYVAALVVKWKSICMQKVHTETKKRTKKV